MRRVSGPALLHRALYALVDFAVTSFHMDLPPLPCLIAINAFSHLCYAVPHFVSLLLLLGAPLVTSTAAPRLVHIEGDQCIHGRACLSDKVKCSRLIVQAVWAGHCLVLALALPSSLAYLVWCTACFSPLLSPLAQHLSSLH